MASNRVIREALQRALESYREELSDLNQRRKDLQEKIAQIEGEIGLNGNKLTRKVKRGKALPYGSAEVKEVMDKTSMLALSGKSPVEAARLVYQAIGRELHAGLVYQVLSDRGVTINAKNRPADVFASYLRRSKDFERAGPGTFKLRGASPRA